MGIPVLVALLVRDARRVTFASVKEAFPPGFNLDVDGKVDLTGNSAGELCLNHGPELDLEELPKNKMSKWI